MGKRGYVVVFARGALFLVGLRGEVLLFLGAFFFAGAEAASMASTIGSTAGESNSMVGVGAVAVIGSGFATVSTLKSSGVLSASPLPYLRAYFLPNFCGNFLYLLFLPIGSSVI